MEQPLISGITSVDNEAKITIRGVPDRPGIAYSILGPVSDAHIVVDMIVQNIGSDGMTDFTFTVNQEDLQKCLDLLQPVVEELNADTIVGDANLAKISGNSESAYGVTPITNVKGLATGSKVRVLGTSDWITSVTYYDSKGRPIYIYSFNDFVDFTFFSFTILAVFDMNFIMTEFDFGFGEVDSFSVSVHFHSHRCTRAKPR